MRLRPSILLALMAGLAITPPSAVRADEPPPEERATRSRPTAKPPSIDTLRDAWVRCAAAVVRRSVDRDDEAEAVADAALTRCRGRETRIRVFLVRRDGEIEAVSMLQTLRRAIRESLVRVVNELRSE